MKYRMLFTALVTATLAAQPASAQQLFTLSYFDQILSLAGGPSLNPRYCFNNIFNKPCLGKEPIYGSEFFYDVKVRVEDFGLLHGSAFAYNSRPANAAPPNPRPVYAEVRAGFLAGIDDTWTIQGAPAGDLGTVELEFDVTGYAYVTPETRAFGALRFTNVLTNASDFKELSLPSTVQLSVPFRFGQATPIQITLGGIAALRVESGGYDTQQADINLGNTAVLRHVTVYDQASRPVAASISTLSGSNYGGATMSPVPELPTPMLFGMGLLALLRWRRKQT